MEPLTELLCFKLGSASRKMQKYYNSKLAEHGITIAQSFIVLSLLEKDGQNVKELAECLSIDSSAITGLVDRLEKEGLVERRVDPNDRRAFRIVLTTGGRELAEGLLPVAVEFNDNLKKNLTKQELAALLKFFQMMEEINAREESSK